MNKSTNNFRKCSFCPHHQTKKSCCCQNRTQVHSVKVKNRSRGKSRQTKKQIINPNQSTISYINSTLPITNNSVLPHLSTNILAQNSVLRTENDYLKRQLHSQYNYVSAFMKDDRNVSTLPTSENQTSRTYQLHDKLYASNRNLQQALIQLDTLSKTNKDLNQLNTRIQLQKQQLRINNQQLFQQTQKLKKKLKKYNKIIENQPNEAQLKQLVNLNSELQKQNQILKEQVSQLKDQLSKKNSRMVVEVQSLSPEWVAHTSTKINAIQRNICKLQQQNKENNSLNQSSFLYKQSSKYIQEDLQSVKKQLISTIKFLKLQNQNFRFGSSIFDQYINSSGSSVMMLVKNLCECILQPVQVAFYETQRQFDKKIKQYQMKFKRVTQRMENMVIKVQNQRLKQRNQIRRNF